MHRGHRQHAQKKLGKDRGQTDRQTHTQTGALITILRNRSRGRSKNRYSVLSYLKCAFSLPEKTNNIFSFYICSELSQGNEIM